MEFDRISGNISGSPGIIHVLRRHQLIFHPFLNVTNFDIFFYTQIFAFLSLSVVILSTVTFVLSTTPQLAPEVDLKLFEETYLDNGTVISEKIERWEEVSFVKQVQSQNLFMLFAQTSVYQMQKLENHSKSMNLTFPK